MTFIWIAASGAARQVNASTNDEAYRKVIAFRIENEKKTLGQAVRDTAHDQLVELSAPVNNQPLQGELPDEVEAVRLYTPERSEAVFDFDEGYKPEALVNAFG